MLLNKVGVRLIIIIIIIFVDTRLNDLKGGLRVTGRDVNSVTMKYSSYRKLFDANRPRASLILSRLRRSPNEITQMQAEK